jgi:hypothetical protein
MTPSQQIDTAGEHLRMDAYYYSFSLTGVLPVDWILSAVATAGKHYHHTESWSDDDDGPSEADVIQSAAQSAAESFVDAERRSAVKALRTTAEIVAHPHIQRLLLNRADAIEAGRIKP